MLRRVLVLFLITGLMAGCAMSSKKINRVKLGMTKSEVIQALGEPSYVAARGDVEVLNYKMTSDYLFTDEYVVRIKNGKVDLFGQRYDFGTFY